MQIINNYTLQFGEKIIMKLLLKQKVLGLLTFSMDFWFCQVFETKEGLIIFSVLQIAQQ